MVKRIFIYYPNTVLFLISGLLLFTFIGFSPIYILDEAVHAEAAREMFVRGDYILPYFNSELFIDKPPFMYYFMMISYYIFGFTAFSARFFSAACGVILIIVTYNYVTKFINRRIALNTIFILLSSFWFMTEFQISVPDPYLITITTCLLFFFYDYYLNRKKLNLFLFYFLIGLSNLTKGPSGVILPLIICFIFILRNHGIKEILKNYSPLIGLLIILLTSAPWYISAHILTDGTWTEGFFLKHNFDRFSNPMEGHGGPFYLTFLYILLGLFPFSFFIPQAIIMRFKAGSTKNFYHFSLIIFITYLLFFSISSTKLPNYTMPSYVFLAVLIAKIIVEDNMKNLKLFSIILISLVIGLIPFLFNYFLKTSENLSSLTFLSYFLFLPAFISFIALVLFFLKKKSWYFFTGLSTIVLFVLLHSYIFPQLNKNNPVSYINSKYENVDFIVYKRMDPAFPFNNKKIYKIFNNELNLITYLKLNPDTYVMTNIRNTKEIDSLEELKIVDLKKSLFEYHFTKIYKLK